MQIYNSKSAKNTFEIGKKIAKTLCEGDILLLTGEMGAGKTMLTKGIAAGLGVCEQVISPTFCLHNALSGKKFAVNHFDFFRILDSQEIAVLGLDEYFFDGSICIIEWWQNAADLVPIAKSKTVTITKTGENTRKIEIQPSQKNENLHH